MKKEREGVFVKFFVHLRKISNGHKTCYLKNQQNKYKQDMTVPLARARAKLGGSIR